MKKITSLLLCVCMLITYLSGCGSGSGLGEIREQGSTSAADGAVRAQASVTLDGSGETPNLKIDAVKAGDILALAKKYYGYHSNALQSGLKGELLRDVGAVSFDVGQSDEERAEKLCTIASILALLEGDGNYAVACAAAAIGWSPENAHFAETLAAVLQHAEFIEDKNRLSDAAKLAVYAGALTPQTVENEGELSKRCFELENATNGMEAPKDKDSAEEALRKLYDLYGLEPITPADMMKSILPAQAEDMWEMIHFISDENRNLGWPDFPLALLNDIEGTHLIGYDRWSEWLIKEVERYWAIDNAINDSATPESKQRTYLDQDMSALEYMHNYNKEVLKAALHNYARFSNDTLSRVFDVRDQQQNKVNQIWEQTRDLDSDVQNQIMNVAIRAAFNVTKPLFERAYTEIRKEGERFWEKMLPFARCTREPYYDIARLYHYVAFFGMLASIEHCDFKHAWYTTGISGAPSTDLEAVIVKVTSTQANNPYPMRGHTFSGPLGPFEVTISSNNVEIESSLGAAGMADFNWMSKKVTHKGVIRKKCKLGVKTEAGWEYVVLDVRLLGKNQGQITDVYRSVGKQAGKGSAMSLVSKGSAAAKHKKELFKWE